VGDNAQDLCVPGDSFFSRLMCAGRLISRIFIRDEVAGDYVPSVPRPVRERPWQHGYRYNRQTREHYAGFGRL
jgi:hypothetical protein